MKSFFQRSYYLYTLLFFGACLFLSAVVFQRKQVIEQPGGSVMESHESVQEATQTPDERERWETYRDEAAGYEFRFPARFNDEDQACSYGAFSKKQVSLFGCDALVIDVEVIASPGLTPQKWWEQQNGDSYTQKSRECFRQETTKTVASLSDPQVEVVSFDVDVLRLDLDRDAVERCQEPPSAHVLLVPHKGNIIKITYDWSSLSEQILSTITLLPTE